MRLLDPHFQAMIAAGAGFPQMHQAPLDKVRRATLKYLATGVKPDDVASIEEVTINSGAHPLRLRIYRPDTASGHPLTLFFHGGGFTICSLDTHDAMCRQICARAQSVLVSVDYRLAPEHPFPAALDDCAAALAWAVDHAAAFGADGHRLAVCGDSAGGNLAAVLALRARDRGGPAMAAQVLIYPVTDHYSSIRASYAERGAGCGLTGDEMRWFWDNYLPDTGLAGRDDVSPLRAASLAGLPPAYVITAEYDVLRDEGQAYAAALAAAGVPAIARHYDTMNHGFMNWVGVVAPATQAMNDLTAWMRATL